MATTLWHTVRATCVTIFVLYIACIAHLQILPEFAQQYILTTKLESLGLQGCNQQNLQHSWVKTDLDQSECCILMTIKSQLSVVKEHILCIPLQLGLSVSVGALIKVDQHVTIRPSKLKLK